VAPDDGVISARTAAVGQVVQPGNELFRLIRQQRLEWRAEVPAGELQRIRPGMPVRITTPAGQAVSGRVRVVAPTVDAQTRNGLVYVDLARGDEARAGMFARGEFELGRAQALTLPQAAVVSREGYSYAFRVEADGRVRQAKVQVGRRLGDRIEIVSGLDANAAVVATGAGFLSDGDLVHVVPGNAVAAPAAAGSGPAPVALR
jgi:RND family efflux transporter MFP subunit